MMHNRHIAVIGLGYVGLPVAVAFARSGVSVTGFDIDAKRVAELRAGCDSTYEVEIGDLRHPNLALTNDSTTLGRADFYIVTVPTPIDAARRPDLSAVLAASRTVGAALKRSDIVVYESTVFPGAVEEECVPVLEAASGLKSGSDFAVAYSPERINPGDKVHRFAPSIKVAEAAKVIENTQRDLNIAFMNELSAICHVLGIDTGDVIEAAKTKWNFVPFYPGLVGGHCIGVDPYYLTHRAEKAGYHPEVILAGRRINDGVGSRVARECIRHLLRRGSRGESIVTVLGLTFKENVPDIRNSKVVDIVRELRAFGVGVQVHDPLASPEQALRHHDIELSDDVDLRPADAVVLAVAHESYVAGGWPLVAGLLKDNAGVVLDVRAQLDRRAKPANIELWRL
jgi:UDP-N-acetyl-D-galactosamine dehydrogenase